jgi:hypothetical protein
VEDLLLEAVVRELSPALRVAPVRGLAPVGPGLAIFLEAAPPRLLLSPGPPGPRFHPGGGRIPRLKGGRGAWPSFAGHAAGLLEGSRLLALEKPPGDRRVALRFETAGGGECRLLLEAFPPGRLLLLDGERRPRALSGRGVPRLDSRGVYVWPPGEGTTGAVWLADPPRVEVAVKEAAARGEDPGRALREAAGPLSPALARVLLRAAPGGEGVGGLLEALRSTLEEPPVAFLLTRAGEAWPESLAAGLPPGETVRVPSAAETAARLAEEEDRVEAFRSREQALRRALERERTRGARALHAVRAEGKDAKDAAELRRGAEALLAAGASARREGFEFVVQDPYEPEGPPLRLEGPPGLDALRTAEHLFRRAGRAERAVEARRRRAAELEDRGEALGRLADRLAACERLEELEALESEAREQGLPVGLLPVRGGKAPPAAASPARVFRSSDGLEILVGRGGKANDRLTFRVAGAEDFWLHAAGVPGAHVVVRNPGGLKELPRRTLREAASLAAHYSKASGEAAADVHLSRRRLVRRARGAPPGTVLVKRFTVVRASTRHPFPDAPGAR